MLCHSGKGPLINFNHEDILEIMRNLDQNKAHGKDAISVRMIKICDRAFLKPLSLLFNNCLDTNMFPKNWKKLIFPIHKKGTTKQLQTIDQSHYSQSSVKCLKD